MRRTLFLLQVLSWAAGGQLDEESQRLAEVFGTPAPDNGSAPDLTSAELDRLAALFGNGTQTEPSLPTVEETECGWSKPGAQDFRTEEDQNDGNTTAAKIGEFPWLVAIIKRSKGNTTWSLGDYIGGGSIIHPSVVLTAYQKINGKPAHVLKCRAGEWDTQIETEIYPHQERNVKKVIVHAEYKRPPIYNSIALLILEAPFDLSKAPHVGIACVAPQAPPAGTLCLSMGWGNEFNDKDLNAVVLKKVERSLLTKSQCERELRKTHLTEVFQLHPSLTCAGGDGRDPCRGDGGAPLVCPIGESDARKSPSRFAVVGMVAFRVGCMESAPLAYVNVPLFYDWIGDHMRAEGFGTTTYTY